MTKITKTKRQKYGMNETELTKSILTIMSYPKSDFPPFFPFFLKCFTLPLEVAGLPKGRPEGDLGIP